MTDTTDLKARLRLLAAWKKPGGKTPSEKMPNVHAACLEAADALDAKDRTIERLREALAFYASPEVYRPSPHGPAFDDRDLSYTAVEALKGQTP